MKKTIIQNLIILVLLPIIGLLLLTAVHLIPVNRIQSNVFSSRDAIESEFDDELIIDGYNATLTGNFTDCLMLEFALYDSPHKLMDQVLNMYRTESSPAEGVWHPGESLIDLLDNVEQPREEMYSRYWHGYLVILKPLLYYTSFNTIRLMNAAIQIILLSGILIVFTDKGHKELAVSLAASMPFMFFFSSFASLSLSICMYILLIGLLIQSLFDEFLNKNNRYITFFIVIGASTAYFDFLTYPLVTMSFPLCAYLFIHNDKISAHIKKCFVFGFSWIVGYIYMWASKWIFSLIFFGKDTLIDALQTIKERIGSANGGNRFAEYPEVLKANLSPYLNRAFLPIFVIFLIAVAFLAFKYGFGKFIINLKNSICLFAIALLPFIWWFAASNHSVQHGVFTCRIFSITVFSLFLAFFKALNKKQQTPSV